MPSTLLVTPTAGRSMLAEILEAIKLRDARKKDAPPALPLRPALRGKLPSTLPVKDEIGEDADPEVMKATTRLDMRELAMGDGLNGRSPKMNFSNAKEMEHYEEVPENPVASGPVRQKHGYSARDDAEKVSSKDDHKLHASRFEVLEKQVESMKAELGAKVEKTVALLQQVQDYEKNWLVCEEKLKSMEEVYQKQIETLKVNIASVQKSSVQKSFASIESAKQPGKCDNFSYYHGYGAKAAVPAGIPIAEGMPTRHLAPETGIPEDMADTCNVNNESAKQPGKCDNFSNYHGIKAAVPADIPLAEGMPTRHLAPETGIPKDMADTCNVIYVVKNDSVHQKQVFEVEARALGEMKSGHSGSVSKSMEDLANLKGRYTAWKREYKMHLRDTKASLEKLEQSKGGKPSRRWCCMYINWAFTMMRVQ